MNRIFADLSLEAERAFIEKRREENFFDACTTPICWALPASRHKRAADILFQIAYEANQRDLARSLADFDHASAGTSVSRTLVGEELEDFYLCDLLGDYFLLMGYAIECALKGYLLVIIPDLVTDRKKIDRLLATHDLAQLHFESGIGISDEEKDLLDLVARHVVWGKYAAPIRVQDMPSWIAPEDQKMKSLAIANPFHARRVQKILDAVFDRAFRMLNAQRPYQALTPAPDPSASLPSPSTS